MMTRIAAILLLAGALCWPGCQFQQFRIYPPEATTQPDGLVPVAGPPSYGVGETISAGPGEEPVGVVIQPGGSVTTQPAGVSVTAADDLGLPVGAPSGVKVEFTMPGEGGPPMPGDMVKLRRAGAQAALATAIYNVTKEINPKSYRDEIENGYVNSDHWRYRNGTREGLEVKSQTVISQGRVKQFDVWLLVPADEGQPAYELHVRNFKLVGDPLDAARLRRLLASAGGHLVVVKAAGPDQQGMYTIDVGLVRKPR